MEEKSHPKYHHFWFGYLIVGIILVIFFKDKTGYDLGMLLIGGAIAVSLILHGLGSLVYELRRLNAHFGSPELKDSDEHNKTKVAEEVENRSPD